jgi:hypothetical protein
VADNLNDSDDKDSSDNADKKILDEAHARFKLVEEAESEIRRLSLEDLEFSAGEQWPENVKAERDRDGRPCLVINRLPHLISQITNDQRQNRPSIQVHPLDDFADVKTAKIMQGLARHVEYNSNADVAYDTAFELAVKTGRGFWRVITDYSSPNSFDQEIFIEPILNPLSVYFDPFSRKPDGSDAEYAFHVEDLSKDLYESKYPNSELSKSGDWETAGSLAPGWMPEGSARVADYFYKEYTNETLVFLSTGESFLKSELPEDLGVDQSGAPVTILKERETKVTKVVHAKVNATEVLEKSEWPGKYIPIVPVYGKVTDINGKLVVEGIVRGAKDPARMYNYMASAEAEAIGLAPRAPFIAAEGQIEGYESDWESANRKNHSVLYYKPISLGGQPAPPPQRNSFEPAVQAITQARMMASDDIKATTGIYDSAVGAQSNEISGTAIEKRTMQSQTGNFHYIDNLTRSIRHTGRILIELFPKIYDTARSGRIIGDDGEQKIVPLNQSFMDEDGKPMIYALDAGQYDVTVDVGPSFQTKRQQGVAAMIEMFRAAPGPMQNALDLLVKNMDWQGATELSERFKKMLPPNLVDDPKAQQVPPQVQAQMQQMNMMIQNLSKELDETTKIIETKKLDLESKERIELMKLQGQLEIKLAELGSKESVALLNNEVASIKHRLELLDMNAPIEAPNDFNPQNADGGNYAGFGHVGGTTNITGGASPGSPVEGNLP